ncbi:hypothetical protein NVP1038O_28 [Vibrio phage 1.038.O._10N.286.51.C2]|nr:hypothetical protein NVP1038O_28 [Vibrio phage 1.038.O._10N.286.51.C2]
MPKLSDVLSKIEENVSVQFLSQSLVKCVDKKRTKDTEVTFATADNDTNGILSSSGKEAIIVWVDRGEFNRAMSELS